jgi:hypothetical protein
MCGEWGCVLQFQVPKRILFCLRETSTYSEDEDRFRGGGRRARLRRRCRKVTLIGDVGINFTGRGSWRNYKLYGKFKLSSWVSSDRMVPIRSAFLRFVTERSHRGCSKDIKKHALAKVCLDGRFWLVISHEPRVFHTIYCGGTRELAFWKVRTQRTEAG